jgi:hypothetical protein
MDLSQATVYVSYEQEKRGVVVEKTGSDLTFAESGGVFTISVTLTQEDTLRFVTGDVYIQIRYVFANGSADASNIIRTTAERILKDGVIVAV